MGAARTTITPPPARRAALALVALLSLGSASRPCLAFMAPTAVTPTLKAARTIAGHARSRPTARSEHVVSFKVRRACLPVVRVGEGSDGATQGEPPVDIFDAIMTGDVSGVRDYVLAGGDCSVQDSIGDTPLMLAVESDMASSVTTLVKQGGADANCASETTGETPLQLAAYYGNTNLAGVLVRECGADLEIRNKKGETALHLACFWGNADTVQFLLEAGADPSSRSDSGELPGDSFDAVFVPPVPEDEEDVSTAVEGAEEGMREIVLSLLEEARAGRQEAAAASP